MRHIDELTHGLLRGITDPRRRYIIINMFFRDMAIQKGEQGYIAWRNEEEIKTQIATEMIRHKAKIGTPNIQRQAEIENVTRYDFEEKYRPYYDVKHRKEYWTLRNYLQLKEPKLIFRK